jgi:hypothetical protein
MVEVVSLWLLRSGTGYADPTHHIRHAGVGHAYCQTRYFMARDLFVSSLPTNHASPKDETVL